MILFKSSEGKGFSVQIVKIKTGSDNMALAYGLTARGIIKNDDGKILIVKRHPKSRTDPKMWELPGGKVEKGEFFADALIREIKEETNLDCEVGDFTEAIQNNYPHKRTVQIMMYLENVKGEVKISDEHTDWMWASLDEIRSLDISTSLKKVLEKRKWNL